MLNIFLDLPKSVLLWTYSTEKHITIRVYVISKTFPLLIRKPDQTKQNFRGPFVKELAKDSGGPSSHPVQWGESKVLKTQFDHVFCMELRSHNETISVTATAAQEGCFLECLPSLGLYVVWSYLPF